LEKKLGSKGSRKKKRPREALFWRPQKATEGGKNFFPSNQKRQYVAQKNITTMAKSTFFFDDGGMHIGSFLFLTRREKNYSLRLNFKRRDGKKEGYVA